MPSVNHFPKDLAESVQETLEFRKKGNPGLHILTELFETLYFVSLKTEELQPITCYIVYLSPDNPDPKPPKRIPRDRWDYMPFNEPVSCTTSNLIKLAKASDPRTSSFAVYHDKHGHLSIWGIIDQANSYHDYINYDTDEGPERPGIFQASILGIGHLVTYIGYEKIAELKTNILSGKTLDVLWHGPIFRKLRPSIFEFIKKVQDEVLGEPFMKRWDEELASYWISSLCRLLLRVQSYHHGGAILITPDKSLQGLNVKYDVEYNRLYSALEANSVAKLEVYFTDDEIVEKYLDTDAETMPVSLHVQNSVSSYDLTETTRELDAAIWFVSLLTRVDGLVLLTPSLEVRGFGVEITFNTEPKKIFRASNENATPSRLKEIDYNHFGTRHRSMMRYCSQIPGSIGFVISQDGDVRAMSMENENLVVWENIKLQRPTNIKIRRNKREDVNKLSQSKLSQLPLTLNQLQ